MAKQDIGKIKMTVIHFETESENATLQENVRAIATSSPVHYHRRREYPL